MTIAARVPSRVTAIVKSLLINARIKPTPKSSFMRVFFERIAVQQYPFYDTRTRVTPRAKSKFVEKPRLMPRLSRVFCIRFCLRLRNNIARYVIPFQPVSPARRFLHFSTSLFSTMHRNVNEGKKVMLRLRHS